MVRVPCPSYSKTGEQVLLTRNLTPEVLGVENPNHTRNNHPVTGIISKESLGCTKAPIWESSTVAMVDVPAETSNHTCQSPCRCLAVYLEKISVPDITPS